MASPTDSYGKWLGDILLATVAGLLLLDCISLLLIRSEIDIKGLAVVNAGIFVVITVLFSVVGLFRPKRPLSISARPKALFVIALFNLFAMLAYGIDTFQHYSTTNNEHSWLRPLMICMYLIASCFYFYSAYRARKSNV